MQLLPSRRTQGLSGYTRVVVKFSGAAGISYSRTQDVRSVLLDSPNEECWKLFFRAYPELTIQKLFLAADSSMLENLSARACELDSCYIPTDLQAYYVFVFPGSGKLWSILWRLRNAPEVELAYPQAVCINSGMHNPETGIHPGTDYLLPPPAGINVLYAKQVAGGTGIADISFIDVEQGWLLTNRVPLVRKNTLTGINHTAFREHGGAVLDIVLGNSRSGNSNGIAPGVSASVVSQWRSADEPNDADAVLASIMQLQAGDILLLEIQTFSKPGSHKMWPAEIQEATFQVIRLAAALGITVIEAAGNGDRYTMTGNDLDRFVTNKRNILHPGSPHFRDSGAVIVSASSLSVPHIRLRSTNYGKRVDCFAPGEGIPTGTLSGSTQHLFGGTSAAAAIIAGAALVIQSVSMTVYKKKLAPLQMRSLLRSASYGTASVYGTKKDKTGMMPDLKKIIDCGLPGIHARELT